MIAKIKLLLEDRAVFSMELYGKFKKLIQNINIEKKLSLFATSNIVFKAPD